MYKYIFFSLCFSSGTDLYPSYQEILKYKKLSYPVLNPDDFTETEAKVTLQNLVDTTVERILINIADLNSTCDIIATHKWGMDGSSGHSEFKQRFMDPKNSDSTVFCTNLVPISLTYRDDSQKDVIWRNENPNSSRYD